MKILGLLLGAGVLALAAGQADATVTLYGQTAGANGGAITQLASDPGSGNLTYGGNYGQFTNSVNAFGAPLLATPSLQSNTLNASSTSAGSLTFYIVQSAVAGMGSLLSSFTANSFIGNVASVVETTYVSQANPFTQLAGGGYGFNATELASATFLTPNPTGTSSLNSTGTVTNPFYEVARYDVTFGAGGGSANNTINIQSGAVPEPASWAMMLMGFGIMGYALRQRRTAKVSFG